ncbi:telomeric repeat-binding factor 2-interacting protein 1 [Pezoporus wallicus]|uniref:telomeric repeat-binding factor 2-interacting protein 1 n=1 Tax=Pezoporus wallicus TaxID=35540 RepID=UPI0025517A9D|nr:telomeric repeat-binding factor 2-interacting protein 1 [Pezoporus wallicus]XP_061327770.1 telomeric repeat-binding factor 2-interacting protein 1 [Pezoporus flaviventris]
MADCSRSLFLCDNGSPMRFYVRPGRAKLRLAPLVLAGGGRLCRVQEPGAVLLAQPGEAAPGGAVSTDYVTECVRRNERLPLEPFRLPAAPAAAAAPRGRSAFSAAEDAALVRAVRERGEERARGRALWQELERAGLMRHSWQAMRDRYLRHLQRAGLFEAANREFETMESRNDASEISGELPTKERISPGETASGLKTVLQESAGPDTRLQMEEQPTSTCSSSSTVADAVKTMQCLMEKSSMDLLTVTQAFLKNSGDVEATLHFLQTGRRRDGYPVWSREDDLELQKDDESVRNKLIAKFGAENIAKRIAFRKS